MSDGQDQNMRDVTPPAPAGADADVQGRQKKPRQGGARAQNAPAPVRAEQAPAPAKRKQAGNAPGAPKPGGRRPQPRTNLAGRAGRDVKRARFRLRHWFILISFLVFVVAPSIYGVWYLNTRAADQYHSIVGFSVRSEEVKNPLSALDAVIQTGPTTASDTDILYEYIASQQIVEEVMAELDLVAIYNKVDNDPYFSLGANPSVEDILSYWESMVTITYDPGSAIIEVEARAFTPDDAFEVADAVLRRSSMLINNLSVEAREDAIQFAQRDLTEARKELSQRRRELRSLRNENQVVDPTSDVTQTGSVVSALEAELARSLVQRRMLLGTVASSDSRVTAVSREIEAIRAQIEEERAKVGSGANGGNDTGRMIDVVGDFEELQTELLFAEQKYSLTQAALEQAKAEARRQSRYLAAHIGPTKAQMAIYPDRLFLGFALVIGLFFAWLITIMILFNVRDRH